MARAETKNRKTAPAKTKPVKEDISEAPVEEKIEEVKTKAKVVNCKNLRVRTSPEVKDNNVMQIIRAGTEVTINPEFKNDEWTFVEVDLTDGAVLGYVMSKYLEVV